MDVATLQKLEATGNHAQIERQLAGLAAHHGAPLLQYAAQYYARHNKPLQSLRCYAGYLRATDTATRNLDAVALAIDCARQLGQHDLVVSYFQALTTAERAKLKSEALIAVAFALLHLGKLDAAEELAAVVRARKGLTPLPDFTDYIRSVYGDAKAVRQFIAENLPQFDHSNAPESIRRAMALAIAHMAEKNYAQAVGILEQCRDAVSA